MFFHMIKLKSLLNEEKLAFTLYKLGKIKFSTIKLDDYSFNIDMFSDTNDKLGYITLTSNFDELGDKPPKIGYLYVDFISVEQKEEGFGLLLYQAALQYCLKNRFKGIVSGKDHRIGRAEKIWNGIATGEDEYYTYSDISALKKIII